MKNETYLFLLCGTKEFEKKLEEDGYQTNWPHGWKIKKSTKLGKILTKELRKHVNKH